jgi:hypothetical protein
MVTVTASSWFPSLASLVIDWLGPSERQFKKKNIANFEQLNPCTNLIYCYPDQPDQPLLPQNPNPWSIVQKGTPYKVSYLNLLLFSVTVRHFSNYFAISPRNLTIYL